MSSITESAIEKILPHYAEAIRENPDLTASQIASKVKDKIKNKYGKRYTQDSLIVNIIEIQRRTNPKRQTSSEEVIKEIEFLTSKRRGERMKEDFDFDFESPNNIKPPPNRFHELKIPHDGYKIGLLYDIHIPYHHKEHLKIAINALKEAKVNEVFLMGDVVDFAELSKFEKKKSERNLDQEIDIAQTFLENLTRYMPNVKVTWKEGNHEFRLERYKMRKESPEAFNKLLTFDNVLALKDFGVAHIDNFTAIRAGKLFIIHGHELAGGGENVSRNKMKRAMANIIFGHSHLSQEHLVKTMDGSYLGSWGVGSLCLPSPDYNPYNQWVNGFAIVTLNTDGNFVVDNKKIIDGKIF